jgi:hypothetical protein
MEIYGLVFALDSAITIVHALNSYSAVSSSDRVSYVLRVGES